nr:TRAP transporter substrate-binding protein [uncultured Celeribacter sp.]
MSLFRPNRRNMVKAAGTCLLLATLGTSPAFAQEFTMKLATATVNDVQTEAIKRFAERVEERSEGRIKTELYPAAQLGSNARMIEGLQFGTVEFYTGPAAYLVGVDSRFQVTDLPAIFEDARHAQRVFSDPTFRETFLNLGADKGLVGLGTYIYGNTAFATAFPGDTVEAFNGKKLRVLASKVERKGVELMGATAVPIDFSEVATALQQGTVDGMKSSPPAFTSLKLYDIVKHITATEDGVMGEVMMVSKIWWDTLPEDLQTMLREEATALEPELYDYVLEDQANAYKTWEEMGGTVHYLPKDERDALLKEMRVAVLELLNEDPKTAEMLAVLLDAADRTATQ